METPAKSRVATVRFGSVSRNLTCLITARFGFSSEIGSVWFGYYAIFPESMAKGSSAGFT